MKLPSVKIAMAAAMVIGLTSLSNISADAQVAPAPSVQKTGPHKVKSTGSLHAKPAKQITLRSMPSNGARAHGSNHRTLLKSGKPTGSNLSSRPSTGSKPGAPFANEAVTPPKAVTSQFDGIGLANSSCGCQPPDVNATIGPNHIVESVNLSIAVYTKNGGLLQNTALSTFLGTADGLSDPRVVYDPTWNRYSLVLTDTSTPSLWFAYSAGPDPTGGWFIYHVGFPFAAGSIVDYPMVGMDQDAYIYTSNNFDASDNYINSTAFTVPKARVYNGFGWGTSLPGVNFNTTPAIVGGHPIEQSRLTYLLSPDDANNLMYVYYFSSTAQGASLTFKGSIPYSWAAPPRRVNQPGTAQTLDPLDGRIDWAVSQLGSRLWFAHGAAVGSFPGVNWGFVAPSNMSINVNTAFRSATSDDFNPSIAAQQYGTTTQEVLSWAYTDTPNGLATQDVYAIHTGTTVAHVTGSVFGPVGGSTSNFRFGDYSSVAPEYNVSGTCVEGKQALVANQYFSPTDGSWRTRLARVHPPC